MHCLTRRLTLALGAAALIAPAAASAAPVVGQPAPAFRAVDADGRTRALSEFRGRTVVLEWTNNGCPYVGKHYGAGNMQATQKQAIGEGAVWLTIISSAPGFQGYLTGPQARQWKSKVGAHSTAVLLDPAGNVGRLYDARATPTMVVIDKAGKVAYMGAIDDRPYSDPSSLDGAKNYVLAALGDLKAGRPVAEPLTRAYGCSVKYATAE